MDFGLNDLMGNIPPITLYTSIISLVLACLASISTEYSQLFFFSKKLFFDKHEWWRLFTSFFYVGPLSINFAINLYMSATYSMRLENTSFYKKSADYAYMLLLGMLFITIISCIYPFSGFLGLALHSMIIYVWCRKNPHMHIQFILIPMKASYFPLFLLGYHYFAYGKIMESDLVGMLVGHIYYFVSDILPKIAKVRGWKRTEFLHTPRFLQRLLGDLNKYYKEEEEEEEVDPALYNEELQEANIKEVEEPEEPEVKEPEEPEEPEEELRHRQKLDSALY